MERTSLKANTAVFAIVVMFEENVTDCRFLQVLKQSVGIVVIELLDKSMLPERFAQLENALSPSELNDIGAKVSNPDIFETGVG